MVTTVQFKKLTPNVRIPARGSLFAAGSDLYSTNVEDIIIQPHETVKFPLGFSTSFETGIAAFIFARSGIATKFGLSPANKVGVIDSDYRGEWIVALHNDSNEPRVICGGDRIAQVIFLPTITPNFVEVEELENTERGAGGFGHTGV